MIENPIIIFLTKPLILSHKLSEFAQYELKTQVTCTFFTPILNTLCIDAGVRAFVNIHLYDAAYYVADIVTRLPFDVCKRNGLSK